LAHFLSSPRRLCIETDLTEDCRSTMHILSFVLVAFVLPFGITAEHLRLRYLVSCGNAKIVCPSSIMEALVDAGATVLDNFPFGVSVIEADENLNLESVVSSISGVTITLDLKVQFWEPTEDSEAIPADILLNQGTTSENGEGRRLQQKIDPPPVAVGVLGKCTTSIC
jgi:hypothetical protein